MLPLIDISSTPDDDYAVALMPIDALFRCLSSPLHIFFLRFSSSFSLRRCFAERHYASCRFAILSRLITL